MLLLGVLVVGVAGLAMCISLGLVAVPDRKVRRRMLADDVRFSELAPPQHKRLKMLEAPEEAARFVVSDRMVSRLEQQLMVAGHPAGWTLRNIVLAKITLPVGMLMVAVPILLGGGVVRVVGVAIALIAAYFAPDLLLDSRGKVRNEAMERALPDLLDKMVIAIEAGLGFETALAKTAGSVSGPLSEELVRTIQDIRLGVSRRDAYGALQARTTCADLHGFIRGIIQAEEHGSSMSQMVRVQSKEMRTRRQLRAETKAAQVGVKITAPLMLCIFPVMFIIVLAPALISALHTF